MEEIKQMVDGEEAEHQKQQQQIQELQGGFEQPEEPENDFSSQSFDQPEQETGQETEKRLQEEIEKFEQDNAKQKDVDRSSPEPEPVDPTPEADVRRNRDEGSQTEPEKKAVNADIPEPAKTRDIDVPDIEKGPLFITRRKFETATRLIYEMRGLSQEIESTVQSMEQDIKRSRDTEQQVQAILDEFEQDRKDVESIISPK